MTSVPSRADFDSQPPMPISEYARTVTAVNVGYELLFTLTYCFLRALGQPDLDLLVVGAGGGMEIERFLPDNPGWRLVGVDPSLDMLALARATAARLGVEERVEFMQGAVDGLPDSAPPGACASPAHGPPGALLRTARVALLAPRTGGRRHPALLRPAPGRRRAEVP